MDNMQWGSFLCGAIVGWWVCLMSRPSNKTEGDFFNLVFSKLKQGSTGIHFSVNVIDDDDDFRRDSSDDDDDDGDGDMSPSSPSYDWSRN